MNKKDTQLLYKLLRDLTNVRGASRITLISLKSLIDSIDQLKNDNIEEQLKVVVESLKNSEPKIIPLIHLVESFFEDLQEHLNKKPATIKKIAKKILKQKIALFRSNVRNVIEHGVECIEDKDVIVVHSASSVIREILLRAKHKGKQFRVLLLKQDFNVTRRVLEQLQKAKIQHTIIPEYDFSHYITSGNKLFVGGIAVTIDKKLIASRGTSNIVSLCHLNKIPSFLFINSLKFSHKLSEEQQIYLEKIDMEHDNCKYCIECHSHDKVELKHINHIIIEKGEIKQSQMKKFRH